MPPPIVILVRPQMGENIGATARAMANFGLNTLRLVAPRDGWPNPKATSMAAGADSILTHATVFEHFSDAIADCHLLAATTARPRELTIPVHTPVEAMALMHTQQASHNTALIFGPERSGLTNDETAHCDMIIQIPTDQHPSLNLAQAVVITAYEWWAAMHASPVPQAASTEKGADRKDLQGLLDQLETYLDEANYWREATKKPIMWRNLIALFTRTRMSTQEIQTLRGLLRRLWEYGNR